MTGVAVLGVGAMVDAVPPTAFIPYQFRVLPVEAVAFTADAGAFKQ